MESAMLTGQCEYALKAGASCNTNLCQVNQICNDTGECLPGRTGVVVRLVNVTRAATPCWVSIYSEA